MNGKTVLVTGASSGIGRATAQGLAELRAQVILVCRDRRKGEETIAGIARTVPGASLDLVIADFASLDDVRRAADDVLSRFRDLHVLINNAATIPGARTLSRDGIEMQFAVNHLAPFLLTNLLLSRLKACAPARIVFVSSDMHFGAKLDFDDLQSERSYAAMRVYGKTKLANVLVTNELARRLEGTGVTVNALHPGVVATGIANNLAFPLNRLAKVAGLFWLSPRDGARTPIYLASSQEVSGVSGKYFEKCRERAPSPASHDVETARRLWRVSAAMSGLETVDAAACAP
ncbi:MAG: SDR family oxidoreductase [Candidatus Hydrogenedentes bacterium]|nr:SDR family oxidoreductase [Candidatus Hydrogenedentota bacterium]